MNHYYHFAVFFLTWIRPFEKLASSYNLQLTDVPIPEQGILSTAAIPPFIQEYISSVQKYQKETISTLEDKYQNDDEKLKRLKKQLPWEITSADGLKLLPQLIQPNEKLPYISSNPYENDGNNSNNNQNGHINITNHNGDKITITTNTNITTELTQLHQHFDTHPAIERLDDIDIDKVSQYIDDLKLEHEKQQNQTNQQQLTSSATNTTNLSTNPTNSSTTTTTTSSSQSSSHINQSSSHINSTPPTTNSPSPLHINSIPSLRSFNIKETIPNLMKTISQAFQLIFWVLIASEFSNYIAQLLQPSLMKAMFAYIKRYKIDTTSVTTWEGLFYALPVGILSFLSAFSMLARWHLMLQFSAPVCASFMTSIFTKLLRVAPYSILQDDKLSIGNITNLMSHDAGVIFHATFRLLQLLSGPVAIAIVLMMLAYDFGIASLVTITLLGLLIPYQVILSIIRRKFDQKHLELQDIRIKANINMLHGLRIAKIYNWESSLEQQLTILREKELSALRWSAFFMHISDTTGYLFPLLVSYITLVSYVSFSNNFTAENVILLLTYLNAIQTPVQSMGEAMSHYMRFMLTLGRINHFLSKEELPVHQSRLGIQIEQYQSWKKRRDELMIAMGLTTTNGQIITNESNVTSNGYTQFQDQNESTTATIITNKNSFDSNNDYTKDNTIFSNTSNLQQSLSLNNSLIHNTSLIPDLDEDTINSINKQRQKDYILKVSNCDFYWSSFHQSPAQMPVLTNISFELKPNEIIGVISDSGKGKTALLNAILGELYPQPYKNHFGLNAITNLDIPIISTTQPTDPIYSLPNPMTINDTILSRSEQLHPRSRIENVNSYFSFNNYIEVIPTSLIDLNCRPKIAYCSQHPWIMNATVRDNIIVNLPYDGEKFKKVVEASALGTDLSVFSEGELTIVAEGGQTLSGGQMARLQFARLLYQVDDVDLVILDDIFAAVDTLVAKTMFYKGVKGILKGKAIILALNSHYDYLQECDQVLYLDSTISTPYEYKTCVPQHHCDNNDQIDIDSIPMSPTPTNLEITFNNNNNDNDTNNNDTNNTTSTTISINTNINEFNDNNLQFNNNERFSLILTKQQQEIQKTLNDVYWIRLYQYLIYKQNITLVDIQKKIAYMKTQQQLHPKSFWLTWFSNKNSNSINNNNVNSDDDFNSINDNGNQGHSLDELGTTDDINNATNNQSNSSRYSSSTSSSTSISNDIITNPNDVDISTGFRPPSTIVFFGPFRDLLSLKLPLLADYTFSVTTHEIVEDVVENDSKFGTNNYELELEQRKKLIDGIEMGPDNTTRTSTMQNNDNNDNTITTENNTTTTAEDEYQAKLLKLKNKRPEQTTISWSTYRYYFQGTRGQFGFWFIIVLIIAVSIYAQLVRSWADIWLVYWSEDEQKFDQRTQSRQWWLLTTGGVLFLAMIGFTLQSLVMLYVWIDSSRHVFKTAMKKIFNTTTSYLDITSLGSLMNKVCGKDIDIVDTMLPDYLLFFLQQFLIFCGVLFIAAYTSPLYIVPIIPMLIWMWFKHHPYHMTAVQVQRIQSSTLSPMYSLFGSILKGTTSIRAYNFEPIFIAKFHSLVNQYLRARSMTNDIENRFARFVQVLTSFYTIFVAIAIILFRDLVNPDLGMLALTSSFRLVWLCQFVFRFYTQATGCLTSVARIEILNTIPQEDNKVTSTTILSELKLKQPKEFHIYYTPQYQQYIHTKQNGKSTYQQKHAADLHYWPWHGHIRFKNVKARYRPELPLVLNNLSFDIEPGSHIGILGRSGAGKSSLLQLFPRLMPIENGSIEIDGIDITSLNIGDLRSRLAIIPQTPTLFEGTIRTNIDPFERYTDNDIWRVLHWVDLAQKIIELPNGIHSTIDEGGANLSASEKQLLAISRALIAQYQGNSNDFNHNNNDDHNDHIDNTNSNNNNNNTTNTKKQDYLSTLPKRSSILIGDEITAQIANDTQIQSTIRNVFHNSTIINIAHRLSTIIQCDKVLILRPLNDNDIEQDHSSVLEYDIPFILLNNPTSTFYSMCVATGKEQFIELYQQAKDTYLTRILPKIGKSLNVNGNNPNNNNNNNNNNDFDVINDNNDNLPPHIAQWFVTPITSTNEINIDNQESLEQISSSTEINTSSSSSNQIIDDNQDNDDNSDEDNENDQDQNSMNQIENNEQESIFEQQHSQQQQQQVPNITTTLEELVLNEPQFQDGYDHDQIVQYDLTSPNPFASTTIDEFEINYNDNQDPM